MTISILRGIFRVTAALTGLLLAFGITYAMEGMTTRIPMGTIHELAVTSLFALPWTLLLCSGFDDLGIGRWRAWIFWLGTVLGLIFLYYLDRYTTDTIPTKIAMPLLAITGGVLPYVLRRLRFLFTICSLVAGAAGLAVLYVVLTTFLSGGSFATRAIGILMGSFAVGSTGTGVLTIASLHRTIALRTHSR